MVAFDEDRFQTRSYPLCSTPTQVLPDLCTLAGCVLCVLHCANLSYATLRVRLRWGEAPTASLSLPLRQSRRVCIYSSPRSAELDLVGGVEDRVLRRLGAPPPLRVCPFCNVNEWKRWDLSPNITRVLSVRILSPARAALGTLNGLGSFVRERSVME